MKQLAIAILAGILAAPVGAQTVIDGTDFDLVVNAARGFGAATLNLEGDYPAINGRIKGRPYYLGFRNCKSDTRCDDFFLQAYYIDPVVDFEAVNGWNQTKRWAKVYVDSEADIVLELDVNLTGGISAKTLDEAFYYWSLALEQFADAFDANGNMTNFGSVPPRPGDTE